MSISGQVITDVNLGDLDALISRLERVEAIIEKYADIAVDLIRQYARVDTGAMRDSAKRILEAWAATITIGEGLPDARAVFNEYGTRIVRAQPMMRPAMEKIAEPFFAELAAVFG